MIQELTKENLQKLGYNKNDVNELFNTIDTFILQSNNGNIFVSKPENKFYTGVDFYRITYFKNGNLRFPYNCPDLVNEYFGLALIEFLEKQKTLLGLLFNEKDQFNKFISNEIERTQKRIDSQKEFLLKMKYHKFESKENDIQICESYINYLKVKQQPEDVKHQHPKFDPNYWNNDCFELFKYLYDCYYIETKRQLTNIWFYLKENRNTKYNLKATKEQYTVFIFENYQIRITNFDKAPTKWEDKEYKTIEDHRINFEDTLK